MRVLNNFVVSATIIAMSTMQALAQSNNGRAGIESGIANQGGGGHGGGGRGVPEIDATAGIAAIAVLLTVAIIVYARSNSTTQTTT